MEAVPARAKIDDFHPDVVHAQYGTATAFLATLATNLPLVVTFRGSDPESRSSTKARCAAALLSRLHVADCVAWRARDRIYLRQRATGPGDCGGASAKSRKSFPPALIRVLFPAAAARRSPRGGWAGQRTSGLFCSTARIGRLKRPRSRPRRSRMGTTHVADLSASWETRRHSIASSKCLA